MNCFISDDLSTVGAVNAANHSSNVDLPAPLRPIKATLFPEGFQYLNS